MTEQRRKGCKEICGCGFCVLRASGKGFQGYRIPSFFFFFACDVRTRSAAKAQNHDHDHHEGPIPMHEPHTSTVQSTCTCNMYCTCDLRFPQPCLGSVDTTNNIRVRSSRSGTQLQLIHRPLRGGCSAPPLFIVYVFFSIVQPHFNSSVILSLTDSDSHTSFSFARFPTSLRISRLTHVSRYSRKFQKLELLPKSPGRVKSGHVFIYFIEFAHDIPTRT